MRDHLVVVVCCLRLILYAAVWLLIFLPSPATLVVISGALISYRAARRGYALGVALLPQRACEPLRNTDRESPGAVNETSQPFGLGYDLYCPSENRWIIGGSELNYPTGDALFDYLHFTLSKGQGELRERADEPDFSETRLNCRSEPQHSRRQP